ncbi:PH domain-containing protein [Prolixibacteraceae bacterium Z1-6]|uniref:PH domain-containing protein n=1 Tax=Draconibacterium aestuarii TaxID=2998507 RepID=A0A9X3FEU6_9BACT|nr:PH domain-containing protein [Prolixibacteraceae bacterium Z1-6]
MNKMDLSAPTRQSIKGLVFIFLQTVRQAVRMFWALIALLVIQKNIFEHKAILPIAGMVIFLLFIAHSVLYYLNFYFYVKDGEFILKKGYLRKEVLTIPLERIQSVNTKQNLIQQFLDVVALEIDTAGTVGKELKIHALEKSFANALHDLLSNNVVNSEAEENIETEITSITEKLILKLEPLNLLKIGISQNHLRTGLIILAFGYQIFNQVQEIFKDKAVEYSGEFVNYMSNSSLALIVFLALFFLLVSVLISLLRTLIKYFEFRLMRKENAYRIEAGIINKRNVVLPHTKIQELNWETGPIKKQFGIYTLVFKQAVSGQNKKVQLVDAPGCLTEHLELLKNDLFGEDKLSESARIYTNPYYFRRLWIFMGWLPVFLATPFLYPEWLFWLAACLWLLATSGYSFLILRKSYFNINNEQIRISSGAISHNWKQMELFKIQSVEFKQTFFQKRRSLASLKLMNASGSLRIPYINDKLAKQIYNYLLYHTEISEKSWM